MRKPLAFIMALALFAVGCTKAQTPAATEEKRLSLYTSFGADLYNPIAQAFEQKTGIKVDIVFGGTGEILKRLEAESGAAQADVMLGGGAESFEAYRGLFTPYKVADDAKVPAGLKAEDRLWYGFNSLPMVIMYNKNMVTESEKPLTWKDLLNPKWKGKLAMADATKSGTSFVQVATVVTLFGRDDGKGWETVRSLVNNAKILGSSSLPPKGVAEGEYAIALTHENAAWKYAKSGSPVGWVYPGEGTATIPDSSAVVKGGKHPQNARLFMDFLFSVQAQELASKQLGLRPSRTDVAPPEGLVPQDKIKFVTLDVSWVSGKRQEILDRWKDVISK